jgi:hypothetical protein
MSAPRFFALSTVMAMCAIAPFAAADSHRSLPDSQLLSQKAVLRVVSQTQTNRKATSLSRNETTWANLKPGHRRLMAGAVAVQQLPGKLDPRACNDPSENCEPLSLVSIGRRIAKYPEPAALSLFGTSLLGIAGVTRRRFFR